MTTNLWVEQYWKVNKQTKRIILSFHFLFLIFFAWQSCRTSAIICTREIYLFYKPYHNDVLCTYHKNKAISLINHPKLKKGWRYQILTPPQLLKHPESVPSLLRLSRKILYFQKKNNHIFEFLRITNYSGTRKNTEA